MGAYYQAVLHDENESIMYGTHSMNVGCKLMEHSYTDNSYCNSILHKLLDNPRQVTWLCDYHEMDGVTALTWDEVEEQPITDTSRDLPEDYYILNHTKQVYIHIAELITKYRFKEDTDWIIHPIPLLCNSDTTRMGGGDYRKEDSRRSTWCGDLLEVSTEARQNFTNVSEDCMFFEGE